MIVTAPDIGLLHGAAELEATDRGMRPHRLPRAVRERFADAQLLSVESQPSGVRLAFVTRSRSVALDLHTTRMSYRGITRPRGRIDIVVDGALRVSHELAGGDLIELDPQTGASALRPGAPETIVVDDMPEGPARVEIWLPHNEQVDLIALHSDAPLHPASQSRPLWVHHGSSISHGSNAASPTQIWPAVAARRAGAHLHNLGFGGSALVDPFLARVIRDAPADVISLKLGINVVNLDSMRLRSFVPAVHGFLDTVRDGHPTTPLLLVSPIFCGIHEETPGPGAVDPDSFAAGTLLFRATGSPGDTSGGRLTLRVIRDALADIARSRSDDVNLHFLDGLDLFGEADAARHPLPDALHPDTVSHALIGERFADRVFGAGGAFGDPSEHPPSDAAPR